MTKPREPGEALFVLALLALSVAALDQAYGISGFSSLSGAGVFPMLAAGTMVLSAAAVLVGVVRRPRGEGGAFAGLAHAFPPRLLLFVALIGGFLVALPYVGFLAAAGAFIFVALLALWRRGFVPAALVTALALVMVWLTFRVAFSIVLPSGSLVPWSG